MSHSRKTGRLVNVSTSEVVVQHVELANTWWSRFIGLQFRKELPTNTALLIAPCSSIHTCWMRFAIDVVFLDADGVIVDVRDNLRPWSICFSRSPATQVLEFSNGCRPASLQIGQRMRYEAPL